MNFLSTENRSNQILQVAVEALAIISNVYALFGHDICIVDHCNSRLTFRVDAVSWTFFFTSFQSESDSMNDFNFRIKVSQTCGPFHNHGYMFEVLRADILKLQEVRIPWNLSRRKRKLIIFLIIIPESLPISTFYITNTASLDRLRLINIMVCILCIKFDEQFL